MPAKLLPLAAGALSVKAAPTRNSANDVEEFFLPIPSTVTRNSYSGCVTDPGPALFSVAPGRLVGVQISVGGNCTAFVEWRLTQNRVNGAVDARFQYTETPDTGGLMAAVAVKLDKASPGAAHQFFQAQCGSNSGIAPSCLGRSTVLPPPTKNAVIAFNIFKLPREEIWFFLYMHPIWQPMR